MAVHIQVTVLKGALLSATRPPARLSRLSANVTTRAIRTSDRDLDAHTYEITIDSEPWVVVDNSFVIEHPSA